MKVCPITSKAVSDYSRINSISYSVVLDGKRVFFDFCQNCFNKIDFDNYRGEILGLILNAKFDPEKQRIHWDTDSKNEFDLKAFLEETYYPKTPKEKFDNLLIQLIKNTDSFNSVNINKLQREFFSEKCYFKNYYECKEYVKSLFKKGLVDCDSFNELEGGITVRITFDGYDYLEQLSKKGSESKNCFIAMAFDSRTIEIRKAIKNAIIKTGFKPIIIDEENINSDQTINDAIIAGIKNSKYCISDFSYHRNGVYFESGFALGLGKPVIYCCSKEEFQKAHFDIKPLQHIIYESEEELEKRLIDKIEAWIK